MIQIQQMSELGSAVPQAIVIYLMGCQCTLKIIIIKTSSQVVEIYHICTDN